MSIERNPTVTATEERSPRQRLLDTADELFYRRGIRNTGVDAILDHARVARKTLYHQFSGKDGLTVEYLRSRDERWTAHWVDAIEQHRDARGRLLAIFDALATWTASAHWPRGCAFLDALVELADPAHPAARVVGDHWAAIESRLLALASEAGVEHPLSVVQNLMLIYKGVLASLMVEPVESAVERGRTLACLALERA